MNKQGLSDIVTVILIILIVLIAIGIIWAFLRPVVNETSRGASAQDCLLVATEPISCMYSGGGQYWYASVSVKRGADQKNVSDIRLVFEDENGATISRSWKEKILGGDLPQTLEKSTIGLSIGSLVPITVATAPLLSEEGACSPVKKTVCERYAYEMGTGCQDFNRNEFGDGDDYDHFVYCYETEREGKIQDPPCMYDYDPVLRKQRIDITHDGGITLDDFNAFVEAFVIGDNDGCYP